MSDCTCRHVGFGVVITQIMTEVTYTLFGMSGEILGKNWFRLRTRANSPLSSMSLSESERRFRDASNRMDAMDDTLAIKKS